MSKPSRSIKVAATTSAKTVRTNTVAARANTNSTTGVRTSLDCYCLYLICLGDTGLNPVTLNPENPASVGNGSGYYAFRGCWPDNRNSRVLNGLSYSSSNMTPLYCAHICWAQRFVYSGVEYGHECWVRYAPCDEKFLIAVCSVATL